MADRNWQLVQIRPVEVDAGDRTYAFSSPGLPADAGLRASVRRCGVVSPVGLERQGGSYRVVFGFRRLEAALACDLETIPGWLIPGDPLELFLLAVDENSGTRCLTPLEKAEILRKLREQFGCSVEHLLAEVLPRLGLNPARQQLDWYLTLARLPAWLRLAVAEGRLEAATAVRVSHWAEGEQRLFLGAVEECRLGVNRQRLLQELLDDLRGGEKRTVTELWEACGLIFPAGDEMAPERRFEHIRQILWERRYPRLAEHQRRFARAIDSLGLPPGISWDAPPFFEGDSYRVSIAVRRREDLERAVRALTQALARPEAAELFELI